jgi:hypothetical protein
LAVAKAEAAEAREDMMYVDAEANSEEGGDRSVV